MITKVLKYTVLSLGLTFVLTSCDDLLEPALENQKDLEALEKEALSVQRLILNAYAALPAYYDNSDYATDDAVTNQKSDAYIKIATGGWTSDNGTLSVWPGSYAAIQYVNLFMKTREGQQYVKNETTNALLTRRLLGEAYGLRGIHLYFLLRNRRIFIDTVSKLIKICTLSFQLSKQGNICFYYSYLLSVDSFNEEFCKCHITV